MSTDNFEEDKFDIEKEMMKDYAYPSPSQDNFQEAIYKKREYYINTYKPRGKLETYPEIKEYRDSICTGEFRLAKHQIMLSNFINPITPYKGVVVFHGVGSGKSCVAIAIAEKFKPMVEKYGTKIHVLVPGPLTKQNFIEQIISCTNEAYIKIFHDKTTILDENEKAKIKKNALGVINQYYRIMSHRSFYKKVLGDKITEIKMTEKKQKKTYRKTETGELERDISIDRIYSLDNTVLIIDEAHNMTNNEHGEALRKIIESSKNLKIVLLTATPMKNLADDIVELVNYLRPKYSQMERDKIFTANRNHMLDFKPGGREYLREHIRGYVSYLRGADPVTFAERVDMGEIPPGLDFTKMVRCFMKPFQLSTYQTISATQEDTLDKKSEAVANFVFPGLTKDRKGIEGYHGIDGMNSIKIQIKNNLDILNKMIAETVLSGNEIKDPQSLIYLTDGGKTISGDIFKEKYLENFSSKFYTALRNINKNYYGQDGVGIIFCYSNLVRTGVELFSEVLLMNGYLEYRSDIRGYNIKNDTKCYFCGHNFKKHKEGNIPKSIPEHEFYPATFLPVTGKTEEAEKIPAEKFDIIKNVFNRKENKDGKFLKIIVGSKVMNEGVTLKNVKEIHILDVHFHLGRIDQAMGRGIRYCVHHDIMNEDNPFPQVKIFKYVISLKGQPSTEEEMYRKAEMKYKLVKKVERIMQEEAIDCPININANVFPEEVEKYKNCGTKDNPCPAVCGYMSCEYKCADKQLNAKYYDPKRGLYRKLEKNEIDYSTYDVSLATNEIEYAKDKIKELYRFENVYVIDDIVGYVEKSYPEDERDTFDEFYVYQALDELIPLSENDFNNFKDIMQDKFNRQGYLIYRDRYYIFQPFDENEDLPIYYRNNYAPDIFNKVNVKDYIKTLPEYDTYKDKYRPEVEDKDRKIKRIKMYDFNSVQDYYESREEFDFVGIIDQEFDDNGKPYDEFKIRKSRPKFLEKKRETGIPTFKGAVCKTSKDKDYLLKLASKINLNIKKSGSTRENICDDIKDKLFDLEKYGTNKDNNKLTYLIIPANHPRIPFPLNLEDRIKKILADIKKATKTSVEPKIDVIKLKEGKYHDIKYVIYKLSFDKTYDKYKDLMESLEAYRTKNEWIIEVR